MTLAAAALVVIQVAIGIVVNLYVTVPAHHPGAHPANYFSGSRPQRDLGSRLGSPWLSGIG